MDTLDVNRDDDVLHVEVAGDGPAVVYLHGLLGDKDVARLEAPSGHRVATYDQRGHGNGPQHTSREAYHIDEFVADALRVLDALAAAQGNGFVKPVLAGTSMGSAVALRLALDHPGRVSALLLAGPAFSDEESAAIDRFDSLAAGLDTHGIEEFLPILRDRMVELGGVAPDQQQMSATWTRHDCESLVAAIRTVGHWTPFPDLERVSAIDVPVAVVGWPQDTMHPLSLAERISELAGGPLGRITDVGDVLTDPGSVRRAFDLLLAAD